MDIETTKTYQPDAQDDLVDCALEAIEARKAIHDLVQVARIAAASLDTHGMRVTARRLRALCDKVQRNHDEPQRGIHTT